MAFSIGKRRVGRPLESKAPTINRTYRIFEDDVHEIQNMGCTAKEVFRLGILAKKGNPQLLARLHELEATNKNLSTKLQKACARLYKLEGVVNLDGDEDK